MSFSEVSGALSEAGALARFLPAFIARDSQQAMAEAVAKALQERTELVVEAGTGTGKTFAYLVPLLLSGARAIVSTATRALQDQLFEKDLPTVASALGLHVQAVVLKGRANYVCPHHLERNLADGRFADPGMGVRLKRIEWFAATTTSGDRAEFTEISEEDPVWAHATSTADNCLGQECPQVRRCFVLRARREAMNADLVIVNHHLFCADLALREDSIAQLLPVADALVFDEAHQLPAVATEFFGESVSTRQLVELARDLTRAGLAHAADGADWRGYGAQLEHCARQLRVLYGESASPKRSVQAREAIQAYPGLPAAVQEARAVLARVSEIVVSQSGRDPDLDRCGERAQEFCARMQSWLNSTQDEDTPGDVDGQSIAWLELGTHHLSLRRTPLSVAEPFARHREGPPRAWIFTSATLSVAGEFGHFTRALGLQGAHCESWPSPFDFAQGAALWVPSDLGVPGGAGFCARLAQAVWPLILANRGRAFFLCTTLRAVRELALALQELLEQDPAARFAGQGLELLVQGSVSRPELLRRFRASVAPVLVGSMGFWEGVDVAGDALSLVIIDKLPFVPPDDPVVRARSDAVRRQGEEPFMRIHLPEAVLALKQGAGRLIRSETDRGVLVIGDERLRTRSYGRTIVQSLPPFSQVATAKEAQAFLPGARKR